MICIWNVGSIHSFGLAVCISQVVIRIIAECYINSYYDLGVESASPTISLLKADRGTVGSNSDYVNRKYTATDKCIAIAIGYADGSIPRVNITSNGTAISGAYCFNYSDYNHGAFGSGIYMLESGQYVNVAHMDPDGESGYMIYALKVE